MMIMMGRISLQLPEMFNATVRLHLETLAWSYSKHGGSGSGATPTIIITLKCVVLQGMGALIH